MTYNCYFDLARHERAALSADDVQSYIDVHLMENGLLRPDPPAMIDIPEAPDLGEKVTVYVIAQGYSDLFAVKTFEEAQSVLNLSIVKISHDYGMDKNINYLDFERDELAIRPTEIYRKDNVMAAKRVLERIAEIRKLNDEATKKHAEATKEVDRVCNEIWDDWHNCIDESRQLGGIIATWNQYLALANGDADAAANFLRMNVSREPAYRDLRDQYDDSADEIIRVAFKAAATDLPEPFSLVLACTEPECAEDEPSNPAL